MYLNVKNTTKISLLDLLAPHSCRGCGRTGSLLCDCCKNDIVKKYKNYCPNCKSLNPTGKCPKCKKLPKIFMVQEKDSLIGELIYELKFSSSRSAGTILAEILNQILPRFEEPVKIVPLPTISRHIRERGFDHTYLIAKKLATLRGKNYQVEKTLVRHANTVQVGTDAKTRKKQASSAYGIREDILVDPKVTYLLLDDIWTTGASMESAYKKLREAGAKKVIISVLAVNRLD